MFYYTTLIKYLPTDNLIFYCEKLEKITNPYTQEDLNNLWHLILNVQNLLAQQKSYICSIDAFLESSLKIVTHLKMTNDHLSFSVKEKKKERKKAYKKETLPQLATAKEDPLTKLVDETLVDVS